MIHRGQRGRRLGSGGRGEGVGSSSLIKQKQEERKNKTKNSILLLSPLRDVLGGEGGHGDDGRRATTDAADHDGLEGGEGRHGC